ncbi:MAG TPA: RagB/SusD family nutrient uptake outer membrane protein, partial [Sediminibacterium sp.]|nr:RagB/SusD family nutrient uptake outer membrane protein [Sediminibacterium sp.]
MTPKYNFRLIALAVSLTGIMATACKKSFLDENPVSLLTTDSYYKTAAGFEDLVKSCYPLLRNIYQTRQLVLNGTDIFYPGGYGDPKFPTAPANAGSLNQYDVGLNGALPEISQLWTL